MILLATVSLVEREQRRREAPLLARIAQRQAAWEGVFAGIGEVLLDPHMPPNTIVVLVPEADSEV